MKRLPYYIGNCDNEDCMRGMVICPKCADADPHGCEACDYFGTSICPTCHGYEESALRMAPIMMLAPDYFAPLFTSKRACEAYIAKEHA